MGQPHVLNMQCCSFNAAKRPIWNVQQKSSTH